MAFTFTSADELSRDLTAKLAGNGIFDADAELSAVNKILNSVPAAEKDKATDKDTASAIVLKYFDSFKPTAANIAPTETEKAVTTTGTSEAPTAAESKAAAAAAKRMFADGIKRSKGAAITAVLTSKPKPSERFAEGSQITVGVSDSFKEAFKNYEKNGQLVPDSEVANNKANYDAMLQLIETKGTTPMYINKDARPTVAGYKIEDKASENGNVYVKKDKFAMAGILVRDYATKIQEVAGVSDIGAYISKRTKDSKGRALVGKSSITVKMTGLNKYFEANPDGEPIYTIDNNAEKENVSAKSEISVKIYPMSADGKTPDKTKKKTIRLSGRIPAAKIVQKPDLDQNAIMAGIQVKAGVGNATTPAFSEADKEILAASLAALGHGQENDTGVGNDLYLILKTPAPVAGSGDNMD